MLLVQDGSWSFIYEENEPFYFNPHEFNPLLSFLDYYAYTILGLDMDSYVSQGEQNILQKHPILPFLVQIVLFQKAGPLKPLHIIREDLWKIYYDRIFSSLG